MNEPEKYLIVGLGNPGKAYVDTRHNAGFSVVQEFGKKYGCAFRHASHLIGDLAQGIVHEKKTFLLLPATFMNSSGDAVRRCLDYYQIPLDHLMVISDEVALPVGTMRIRSKGSSGGHNGLKSIQAHIHTEHYARLRIGVGAPGYEALADFVLGRFSSEEKAIMDKVVAEAAEALALWVKEGIAAAMQFANAQKDQVKKEEGEKNG